MASSTPVCGICDSRHIYKASAVWCPECDEGLCMDCTQHHSSSKGTKHHNTIPISDYQKLPSFVLDISQLCQEHNERYRFYCRKDECPCCEICMVENHEDCKNVDILKSLAKNVRTSVQFKEVEQLIDELMITVNKIKQNREKNSVDVTEQKRIVESEIRELRTNINNHLDKLQDELMKELTETETKISGKTSALLSSLDETEKDLTEYQTNVVIIKQYASELQIFLAMKKIESGIETHDTSLHALVHSDSLNQTKLSCKIEKRLKNIITSIETFGEVVVESKPCELSLVRRIDKQAQMMVAELEPMSVNNIRLNLKQKISIKGEDIRGCSLLPDGRMVLSCCITNTVNFINKDGVELFQIGTDKTGSCTYDTVYIKDNNSVAVSSGWDLNNRCITIIDIENQQIMTTISMDTEVYGIAVGGRTIYYFTEDGQKMLNLSDKSVSDIISRDMSYVGYVVTSGGKLYYTNYYAPTVTCCDLHGTTQWEFNDERVLQAPHGITIDNDGNVYVVGYYSSNVVVISPDGQCHRQLLSDKDGLKYPRVLDYDRSTNRLLVVNEEGTGFLFDVTKGQ